MCQGLTNTVKFHRKDQSVQESNQSSTFTMSCISFIFLIGIGSFCINFIKIYPSLKIDHFPHLRIHLLYTDQLFCLIVTWINSFYLSLLSLFTPIACFAYVMYGSMH